MRELERITDRRSELDVLAEESAKQLHDIQTEREEPVVAERVLRRLNERVQAARETSVGPAPARIAGIAGRTVLLVAYRAWTGSAYSGNGPRTEAPPSSTICWPVT
jgi:hypothetical protein